MNKGQKVCQVFRAAKISSGQRCCTVAQWLSGFQMLALDRCVKPLTVRQTIFAIINMRRIFSLFFIKIIAISSQIYDG